MTIVAAAGGEKELLVMPPEKASTCAGAARPAAVANAESAEGEPSYVQLHGGTSSSSIVSWRMELPAMASFG